MSQDLPKWKPGNLSFYALCNEFKWKEKMTLSFKFFLDLVFHFIFVLHCSNSYVHLITRSPYWVNFRQFLVHMHQKKLRLLLHRFNPKLNVRRWGWQYFKFICIKMFTNDTRKSSVDVVPIFFLSLVSFIHNWKPPPPLESLMEPIGGG